MSKRRKHTGGNPAKSAAVGQAAKPPVRRHCAYCGRKTSVQPEQVSTEMSRLPHHPRPSQYWAPGCGMSRKESLHLLGDLWQAEGAEAA